RTTGQTWAKPMKGRKKLERLYPRTMMGFRFRTRSAQMPEKTFKRAAVDSATPSMTPKAMGPAPKTWDRKRGRIGKTISVEASVKKLTSPRRKTVLGTEGNNFMGAIVSEKQSGVIGKGLVSYPRSGLFPVLFRAR